MKIAKGHYVPKELITSEAVHEAVVECFVAAGFLTKDNHGLYGGAYNWAGLGVTESGFICWTDMNQSPLTIQQLFTAENGLQWPDWADEIRANKDSVYFSSAIKLEFLSGSSYGGDSTILATRQPKENEVKSEALDKAVIQLNGVLPENIPGDESILIRSTEHNSVWGDGKYSVCYRKNIDGMRVPAPWDVICDTSAFQQRAKELGCINGYRWGVEYQSDGNKIGLHNDIIIDLKTTHSDFFDVRGGFEVLKRQWFFDGPLFPAFKITDPRHKPADTSYLNASTQPQSLTHSEEGLTHKHDLQSVSESSESKCDAEKVSEWWDYENDKAIAEPPLNQYLAFDDEGVISECHILYIGNHKMLAKFKGDDEEYCMSADSIKQFRPLDHATRKAELEKKKDVEQGAEILCEAYKAMGKDEPYFYQYMESLYAAGWRPTK